ncbi:MAG: IS21 family transposase [Prevotellaceae bacterium]|jgi:transposase|nr:IS21 family transposase [Prevotellaceae bacterium]
MKAGVIMRKDVAKSISKLQGEELGMINKSEMARRMGCSRRTVERYIKHEENPEDKKIPTARPSLMDGFKETANEKVDKYGASAMAVYKFIKKKGYMGKYCTVANYVKTHKANAQKKATIRFETSPGLQAQTDWKESVKMTNRQGEEFLVNIFLTVLGYSRLKYVKLTVDRTQKTLFSCIIGLLAFYGGVPHEILFDNMSTVVDRSKTTFKQVVINDTFKYFADDAGFEPITCRPYRAKTKGKVESLAKLVERLRVYNEEFDTFEELEAIMREFMEEVNNESSQATGEIPNERFKREKEYLRPLPCMHLLSSYISHYKEYKVSKESMINYKGCKYSVPTYYIGKSLHVIETDEEIKIYYDEDIISRFTISEKRLNYKTEHVREILASDALSHLNVYEIDSFIQNNLSTMDILLD